MRLTLGNNKHLAVIMDGNRRWAKARGLPSIEGHRVGVKALKSLVSLAPQYGIKYLTVYAFSTENWNRDNKELNFLFSLLGQVAIEELANLSAQNIQVKFLGDIAAFTEIYASLKNLEERTQDNTGLILQIALNYGAINELRRAIDLIRQNHSKQDIETLSLKDIEENLYSYPSPAPDILIRTGGEKRLSNFLLWQCSKSYLCFLDTLWPDFSQEDLEKILEVYGSTQNLV